jgi:hypothetical protein
MCNRRNVKLAMAHAEHIDFSLPSKAVRRMFSLDAQLGKVKWITLSALASTRRAVTVERAAPHPLS